MRSGKELPSDNQSPLDKPNEEAENNEDKSEAPPSTPKVSTPSLPSIEPYIPKALFPSRLARPKQEQRNEKLIEMLKKVQINIPFLNAIQQIPRYAKFLKKLCTKKRTGKDREKVVVSENISALLKHNIPEKCRDLGIFTLSCIIGNRVICHATFDLGASINVKPYHVYEDLKLNDLQKTVVCIQLADRSYIQPLGIVEDVLLQVKDLIFPVDFYILKMDEISTPSSSTILLGRPFMKTAKTKIDVDKGCLSIKSDGKVISFNIYDAMKFPEEYLSLCLIEAHDVLLLHDDNNNSSILVAPCIDLDSSDSHDLSFPVVNVQTIELKAFPIHLKYMYLGEGNTLPVIISRELMPAQKESLIETLKTYNEAVGWTLDDLKGVSPSLCMYWITLEEGAKPTVQHLRRFNPN
ncbi:uncharacterized protein LOC120077260 [Benincasa hispida]|uniref:uncharacterized protein LOC120077260 n=1 Tax=Benincasa hispida TaxID=102211 RepID=UPI0019014077|nr:uncharacterized protein LOC120077260 [Benincasa hispida]